MRRRTTQVVTDQSFLVFSDASEDAYAYAAVKHERNVYGVGSISVSNVMWKGAECK